MPYSPKYSITNAILKNVGIIDSAREVIATAPLVPAWERRFRSEARAKIIHHGTHLEGNDLNLEEVEQVLDAESHHTPGVKGAHTPSVLDTPVAGRDRDIQEVINYRSVMDYIDSLSPHGSDLAALRSKAEERSEPLPSIQLTRHILQEIHRRTVQNILPQTEAGDYRTVKVVIRNTATHEISFRPPPPTEVAYLIEELFEWMGSEAGRGVHPLLRSGILHYELARIHPFTDGNGRTARAMALLLLYLEGYEVKKFFALEEYYDQYPEEYYRALQSVASTGELTQWLEYFTLGISIEFGRIKTLVQKLSLDLHLKHSLGGHQITLTDRQIRLVEYIEKYGSISMKDARDILPDVSEDTILRDLRALVQENLLIKKGNTKGSKYYLKNT